MAHPLSQMSHFAQHVESLSYMAVHKLGEALDVRDGRVGTAEQRLLRFKGLSEEAEALVFAVQQLGTDQQQAELLERLQHIRIRHEMYLADEKERKALRKARTAVAK